MKLFGNKTKAYEKSKADFVKWRKKYPLHKFEVLLVTGMSVEVLADYFHSEPDYISFHVLLEAGTSHRSDLFKLTQVISVSDKSVHRGKNK